MSTATESIVRFVHDLEFKDIPETVIEDAKFHILDGVGVIFPASLEKNSETLLRVIKQLGGNAESTILVSGERSSRTNAALMNGMMMGTTLDFDDLHVGAGLHPTTVVLPSVLAAAEVARTSGKELLTAYVAAAEVAIRMGLTSPGRFHRRGFQPTSIWGTLAAALGAGKILGLSEEKLTHCLGIATNITQASPLSVSVGSYFQGVDTGRACEGGIFSAILAQNGFTTIKDDVLENQFGFLNTFAGPGNYSTDPLILDLGKVWNLPQTFLKRYPTTYAFTRYLDVSLELREKYAIKPEDIKEITYGVNSEHGPLFNEPRTLKVTPPNRNEARTSQYYTMAAAFVDGVVSLDTFDGQKISDPGVLEIAGKIRPVPDDKEFWVRAEMKNGKILKAFKNDLRQTSKSEVVEKFFNNAERVISKQQAEEALTVTMSLEKKENLGEWLALLIHGSQSS